MLSTSISRRQPQPRRKQPGPRAHGVVFSSHHFAYVCDIGLDRVYSYDSMPRRGRWHPLIPICRAARRLGPATAADHRTADFSIWLARAFSLSVFAVDNGHLREMQSRSDRHRRLTGSIRRRDILLRYSRHVPVRLKPRAWQYRGVRHRPRREAVRRRTRGVWRSHAAQLLDRPDRAVRVFVESGHGEPRRPAHRPRDGPVDADRSAGSASQSGLGRLRPKVVSAFRRTVG